MNARGEGEFDYFMGRPPYNPAGISGIGLHNIMAKSLYYKLESCAEDVDNPSGWHNWQVPSYWKQEAGIKYYGSLAT